MIKLKINDQLIENVKNLIISKNFDNIYSIEININQLKLDMSMFSNIFSSNSHQIEPIELEYEDINGNSYLIKNFR